MQKIKQCERPYIIAYIKGERCLYDSATTLEKAKGKIDYRLSNAVNKKETARVFLRGELVFDTVTL